MRITKPVEKRFDYPDDPDKHWVLIRHVQPGETSDIVHGTTKFNTEYVKESPDSKGLTPKITSESAPGETQKLIFLKSIADWGNMYDEDGELMECTDEGKERAMRQIPGYLEWVTKCQDELDDAVKEGVKILEKNS